MKKILVIAGLIMTILVSISSCERIDAGHVGVQVDMYGSSKGVNGVTECTGWVFYNPITTKIYEFPVYIQHKEYKGDDSFTVNTKDGSEFHVSPIINYSIKREKVPYIFAKYRRSLEDIESGFLKTAVYDAFRLATNNYTAEDLISNRQAFEIKVRQLLEGQLLKEGFVINQFTSNLEYPGSFNVRDTGKEIELLSKAASTNPADPRVKAAIDMKIFDWLDLDEDEVTALQNPTLLDINNVPETVANYKPKMFIEPITGEMIQSTSEAQQLALVKAGWVEKDKE